MEKTNNSKALNLTADYSDLELLKLSKSELFLYNIIHFFKGIPNRFIGILKYIWNSIVNFFNWLKNDFTDIINTFITGDFKTKIEGLFANMVKPILEQYQLVESAKATDVDEISISAVCPKYQNGIAHVVKLPGFSKAFSEKFLK